MVASNYNTEPIVPLWKLVKDLECKIGWDDRGLVVVHPKKGKLEVYDREGCPHVPKEVALELIQELEEKEQKKIRLLKKGQEEKEEDWIRELIKAHPVLRKLPEEIQSQIVDPTSHGLEDAARSESTSKKEGSFRRSSGPLVRGGG